MFLNLMLEYTPLAFYNIHNEACCLKKAKGQKFS